VKKVLKCWEFFKCEEKECPVYRAKVRKCWLIPGTHCRNGIQGKFLEKLEMCLDCEPLKTNLDRDFSMKETLKSVSEQFVTFRRMVDERDRDLEGISMELALGLSEAFEALQGISSGDPSVRIPEVSKLELISKLKHMINLTAENLTQIVDLSHEFAIGLAEHFDVLHRVSRGDLTARVLGSSPVDLLVSLQQVTNEMIESVSREITERKRVEDALRTSESELRESEEKYRTLFDYAPNSIFVLASDTFEILDVNARAEEVYGYDKGALVGRSFMELGTAEYPDGVLSKTRPRSRMPCIVYNKIEHRKKDGQPFHVNVYACQRQRSRKYGIIATTVDVSESLAKEAQLIQASKMSTLGEMATGVAHELNQPLTSIQIGTDFIRNVVKEGGQIRDTELALVSKLMGEQVARAVGIINHLREFGRKEEIRKEKVYINEPIKRVFALVSEQLKLRRIKVVFDLKRDLPPVIGNTIRLEQVFMDLVVNARDAMVQKEKQSLTAPVDKTLTVRSFEEDGQVVVTISDTGVGIPKEITQKIFEPFFTTKKLGEGTGLGLSIGYGIVKDYDGTIEVESEPGKGTTFKIRFPALKEDNKGVWGNVQDLSH
jgi:PAS domain S-box-containing protein